MPMAEHKILGLVVGSTAPAFLAVLSVHVAAALTAVVCGTIAAVSAKGSPRHIRAGRVYYRSLIAVFLTALALTTMRPKQDWYLAVIGAVAVAAAFVGVRHRRRHKPGDTGHIIGMGASFAALLTAFYVDNGPHLPLWNHLPTVAFWIFPGVVGAALIFRSVRRLPIEPSRRRP